MNFGKAIGKVLPLIVTLVPLITTTFISPANAAEWVRILSDDNAAFYIDTSSIEGTGRYRYYWQLVAFQRPQSFRTGVNRTSVSVYGYAIYSSIDCRTKFGRVRRLLALDRNNRTLMEINMNEFGPLENINGSALPARYAAAYACRSGSTR